MNEKSVLVHFASVYRPWHQHHLHHWKTHHRRCPNAYPICTNGESAQNETHRLFTHIKRRPKSAGTKILQYIQRRRVSTDNTHCSPQIAHRIVVFVVILVVEPIQILAAISALSHSCKCTEVELVVALWKLKSSRIRIMGWKRGGRSSRCDIPCPDRVTEWQRHLTGNFPSH